MKEEKKNTKKKLGKKYDMNYNREDNEATTGRRLISRQPPVC